MIKLLEGFNRTKPEGISHDVKRTIKMMIIGPPFRWKRDASGQKKSGGGGGRCNTSEQCRPTACRYNMRDVQLPHDNWAVVVVWPPHERLVAVVVEVVRVQGNSSGQARLSGLYGAAAGGSRRWRYGREASCGV